MGDWQCRWALWLALVCGAFPVSVAAQTRSSADTVALPAVDPMDRPLQQARQATGESDPEVALRIGRMQLAQARQGGDGAALMDALEYLLWLHIGQVQVDAARPLLAEMRLLAQQGQQPLWLARVLHAEGVLARRLGQTGLAVQHLEEALLLRREYADQAGEIQTLNTLSILRRRAGQLYLALDGHKRALELARALGDPVEEAESLSKIGRIYKEMDDIEPALAYYREAIEVIPAEALVDRAEMFADLAGILQEAGLLDEAEQAVLDAERLARISGNPQTTATALARRARLETARGRHDQALLAIESSIEIGRPHDGARSMLVRHLIRAGILNALARYEEAAAELARLLIDARRTEDLLSEREILELQGPVLMAVGQPQAAFAASQAFNSLDRQLNSSITARRIADMQATLESREMASEMALMGRERDLQALELKRKQQTLLLSLVALAGLLLTALALAWRYRAMRALNAELERRGTALRRAAVTDALTGLANRHAFSSVQESARPDQGRACMLLDIDHFKQINDCHGHPVGDEVLRELARRIAAALPAGMQALRWGGEEFLLAGACEGEAQLAALAEQLRSAIAAEPVETHGLALRVSTSVGHAHAVAGSSERWEDLLRRADDALYAAKRCGRNRSQSAPAVPAGSTVVPLLRP